MRLFTALMLTLALVAATQLEWERSGLSVAEEVVGETPVTLWRPDGTGAEPLPLVVVAHGYAGSRQMMRAFAVTLARSGFAVASVDLLGHGRHPLPMTGDVTRLDGATAALTRQVEEVTHALLARPDLGPDLAFLGHSMATDIVVRAAESLSPDAVVAVSMYSEAVTSDAPVRLLILSGARETRLRANARDAIQMVDASAAEGETVTSADVVRRAAVAPIVGHVGVLYAPAGLVEARDWIGAAFDRPADGQPPLTALWLGVLLAAILALARPTAQWAGPGVDRPAPIAWRTALLALTVPIIPAVGAAAILPDLGGLLALAPVGAFLGVWGALQIGLLWRAGARLSRPLPVAIVILAVWSVALFALALDRYGAAFLPVGPRLLPAILLLPTTLLFVYGDSLLTQGAGWGLRLIARILPLAALLTAMLLDPLLGVAFTVLPVILLFWLVYGTAGRWVAARAGHGSTAPVLGAMLAWAIAASTPLIAG